MVESFGRMAGILLSGVLGDSWDSGGNCSVGCLRASVRRCLGGSQATDHQVQQFLGRIEATNRVSVVARVTAFLEKNFAEGRGRAVSTLSVGARPVRSRSQIEAGAGRAAAEPTLVNAKLTTDRARTLPGHRPGNLLMMLLSPTSRALKHRCRPRRRRSTCRRSISTTLDRSPINGNGCRTAVTEQCRDAKLGRADHHRRRRTDVRHVSRFQSRSVALRDRSCGAWLVFKAIVIRVRLTDGRLYEQIGQLNFVNNTIAQTTTFIITLRGTIPNPPCQSVAPAHAARKAPTMSS